MKNHEHVLGFDEIAVADIAIVGGKGSNLAELARLGGVRVPPGFCVATSAFRHVVAPAVAEPLARLSRASGSEALRTLSADIRRAIEALPIPDDLAAAITARLGNGTYAVRSSATAEDLPTASFAGQQDSFLNVGRAAILEHVSQCWASLFTERAVTYRQRNRIDHRSVSMAVVVQEMVAAKAAGVLFTADPVSGHRKVVTIEAVRGLGEALVSGRVNADHYEVREGVITARTTSASGMTDAEVVRLADLGRRIEAHFGRAQDIEWCLADDGFHFVQSRPITTLFPIPAAADHGNRVYLSVGHQQMMTDAMKPLGFSLFQLAAGPSMHEAGGRLFVDATERLASPVTGPRLMHIFRRSDPLVADALQTLVDRGFLPPIGDAVAAPAPPAPPALDASIIPELIAGAQASIARLKDAIRTTSGAALFDFIRDDIQELKRLLFDPRGMQLIVAATEATWWLNEHLEEWLGVENAADKLTLSAPGNVTSEMGLALLDVADVIRPHAEVVAYLKTVDDDRFLHELPRLNGGSEARDAILAYLDRFGMRCAGEIDITNPRWSECPATLVPVLLGHIYNSAPGEGERRFERGRQEAANAERELLAQLRALPDGETKAEETKRMIDRVRAFVGYREYPKYAKICRYFVYKQAMLAEAERLRFREKEDIFYLTFEELHEVARTRRIDAHLIRQRKDTHHSNRTLTPPRVLTSEGEAVTGTYRREGGPAGALVGLPVSAGTIEGRARVLFDMADANFDVGDILVTAFTDPGWTPVFVTIAGLVTEVGGSMSHGAVIAREYGLPAVVGVVNATRLIRDGQRIRVHGASGYVEIMS